MAARQKTRPNAPKVLLPLLGRDRLADKVTDKLLLVRVEHVEAADEFLEVVQEIGTLVVWPGRDAFQGGLGRSALAGGYSRIGAGRYSFGRETHTRRSSKTRPGPRQTRKGCLCRDKKDPTSSAPSPSSVRLTT